MSVLLYEPVEAGTAVTMSRLGTGIKLTAGRAVLVGLVDRYLAGLVDLSISLLEIHKLLYFRAGGRRAVAATIQESAIRPLCREPSPRDVGC